MEKVILPALRSVGSGSSIYLPLDHEELVLDSLQEGIRPGRDVEYNVSKHDVPGDSIQQVWGEVVKMT
jgi:hypothetical protein